jgi:selenocysteine lyase/cysteine desulfurase
MEKHKVHVVRRKGVANGPVIRVTPALFTTHDDVDALASALRAEHALFL